MANRSPRTTSLSFSLSSRLVLPQTRPRRRNLRRNLPPRHRRKNGGNLGTSQQKTRTRRLQQSGVRSYGYSVRWPINNSDNASQSSNVLLWQARLRRDRTLHLSFRTNPLCMIPWMARCVHVYSPVHVLLFFSHVHGCSVTSESSSPLPFPCRYFLSSHLLRFAVPTFSALSFRINCRTRSHRLYMLCQCIHSAPFLITIIASFPHLSVLPCTIPSCPPHSARSL